LTPPRVNDFYLLGARTARPLLVRDKLFSRFALNAGGPPALPALRTGLHVQLEQLIKQGSGSFSVLNKSDKGGGAACQSFLRNNASTTAITRSVIRKTRNAAPSPKSAPATNAAKSDKSTPSSTQTSGLWRFWDTIKTPFYDRHFITDPVGQRCLQPTTI